MVSLTCSTRTTDDVTLVTGRLAGGATAQRVRITNRLEGPVWPPRRNGLPEAGWDDDGFETVVPAGGTVAVGYASPAPAADPPLSVTEREVVDPDEATDAAAATAVETAVRDLGDPSPPRDAIPVPGGDESVSETSRAGDRDTGDEWGTVPDAVDEWIADVEARVALVERLGSADSLPEATAALREAGSLADAADAVDRVEREAAALDAVADQTAALADRAGATSVPLATFERIA